MQDAYQRELINAPQTQIVSFIAEEEQASTGVSYSAFCQSRNIPTSELQYDNDFKLQNRKKYQRNHQNQYSLSMEKEYVDLVFRIKEMRKSRKDVTREVKKLEKLKKKRKNLKKFLNKQLDNLSNNMEDLCLNDKSTCKNCKSMRQVRKQRRAVAHSGIEDIKHYGCTLLDGLHALVEYMKSIREVVGEETLRFTVSLTTTLYNVYHNSSWSSLLLNFSNFFLQYFPQHYAEYAMEWLKSAFSIAFTQGSTDSYKEFISNLFSNSSDLLDDQLWKNISEFFVKLASLYAAVTDAVSFEALDIPTILKQFKIFRKQLPEVKDLIEMAFMAYEFVLGNWKNIVTGNWSQLLLGKDETQEFELEVRFLEQAFTLVLANKEIELKSVYGLTKDQYETRLAKAIKVARSLITRCTSVQQRMSVSNFIRTLTDKQAQIFASIADAPRRPEAYAIKFSGPSGCGKSTLLDMCAKIILNAYGFDPTERGQVVLTNISEKFESTIFPSHKIICADDIANNKNEKPNFDRVLNYVNTVPRPLEKADTKEKGIYYPGNSAFMATTNDITLRAVECSCCPESILRRFALDVCVEIRDEFKNEYGGLAKTDLNFEVYKLTLKRFERIENGVPVFTEIPRSEWNQMEGDGNDLAAFCKFLAMDVKRHIIDQKQKEVAQKALDDCVFCSECNCPEIICKCDKDNISDAPQVQLGLDTLWASFNTAELWDIRAAIAGSPQAVKNLYLKGALYAKIFQHRRELYKWSLTCLGALMLGSLFSRMIAFPIFFGTALRIICLFFKMKAQVENELEHRVDRLSCLCVGVREHLRQNIKKYFGIGAAFLAMYNGYRVIKPLLFSQDKTTYFDFASNAIGKILSSPKGTRYSVNTQDERDYKDGYSRISPKETMISRTTTSADLQMAVCKCLRSVIVRSKGKMYGTVNGILVASNVIMVPSHVIPDTFPFDIETSTTPGVPSAKTKDQRLTEEFCVIDREHDVAFVHLSSAPAGTDFSRFFPEEYPQFRSRATTLLWKSPSNDIYKSEQTARELADDVPYYGMLEREGVLYGTRNTVQKFVLQKGKGLRVDLEFESFAGLCGGLYLDSMKGIIYGFHVAGYENSKAGFLTCIIRSQIQQALETLEQKSPTMVVHSAGPIKVDTYGTPYTLVNTPPLYTREDGTGLDTVVSYFGSVRKDGQPLESRARSPYYKTPFNGIVDALGPSLHKPPTKVNAVEKGMLTLNKLTNPVQHYEGDILKLAIDDYREHTLQAVLADKEELRNVLRIYSQEEAMDGIGEFGLGGLPNSTSAGFPINKSKKDCLVRDPMDESLIKVPREFNDKFDIQGEIDRTMEAWSTGTRSEPIYKASSKVNELLPNKKADAKVRKFYGSGFANFVASRRVLAGVARFMRKHWKVTECMVGMNVTSREWDDFHEYLTEYGIKRMLAGDFSGFDTRMAAQITSGAARIIIAWYEAVGCTADELKLVRGALSDIIHPNVLFDGDLYRFANGNPSGNMITVQLNSVCNSIMMRYVYYSIMRGIREPFASNVRLGTYGDDNAMSVKKHCTWFNHTACQNEFEKLDIGYTMADKDAKSVEFITIDEISFLKRSFRKHDTLSKIVAPIEIDSTLKKFHYVKKPTDSPLTPAEQFGAHTDGAFRDMYLRGRAEYDSFQDKIREIVQKNPELRPQVSFIPYDEMTQLVAPDYADDYVNNNKKLFSESMGVSVEELTSEWMDVMG